jgi:hypothetical protein
MRRSRKRDGGGSGSDDDMIPNNTSLNTSEIAAAVSSIPDQFYYQNITVIFAAITFTITLFALVYKYGQHVGEMKGIREVIDAKLESIDQKYNTTEKLQKLELDIKDKVSKDYVDTNIDEIESELNGLVNEIARLKAQTDVDINNIYANMSDFDKDLSERVKVLDEKFALHSDRHQPPSGGIN